MIKILSLFLLLFTSFSSFAASNSTVVTYKFTTPDHAFLYSLSSDEICKFNDEHNKPLLDYITFKTLGGGSMSVRPTEFYKSSEIKFWGGSVQNYTTTCFYRAHYNEALIGSKEVHVRFTAFYESLSCDAGLKWNAKKGRCTRPMAPADECVIGGLYDVTHYFTAPNSVKFITCYAKKIKSFQKGDDYPPNCFNSRYETDGTLASSEYQFKEGDFCTFVPPVCASNYNYKYLTGLCHNVDPSYMPYNPKNPNDRWQPSKCTASPAGCKANESHPDDLTDERQKEYDELNKEQVPDENKECVFDAGWLCIDNRTNEPLKLDEYPPANPPADWLCINGKTGDNCDLNPADGKPSDGSSGGDNDNGNADNEENEEHLSFWESDYPDGFQGLWTQKKEEFKSSKLIAWLNGWGFAKTGTCPSFEIDFSALGFGSHAIAPYCWVWDIIRALMMLSAMIAARRLVFGG